MMDAVLAEQVFGPILVDSLRSEGIALSEIDWDLHKYIGDEPSRQLDHMLWYAAIPSLSLAWCLPLFAWVLATLSPDHCDHVPGMETKEQFLQLETMAAILGSEVVNSWSRRELDILAVLLVTYSLRLVESKGHMFEDWGNALLISQETIYQLAWKARLVELKGLPLSELGLDPDVTGGGIWHRRG